MPSIGSLAKLAVAATPEGAAAKIGAFALKTAGKAAIGEVVKHAMGSKDAKPADGKNALPPNIQEELQMLNAMGLQSLPAQPKTT